MRYRWTEERLSMLKELYPIETNRLVAERLGISERTVKIKAASLGLQKYIKSSWLEQAMYVRSNFGEKSYSEMAKELNVSSATICRMVKKLGLKRTKKEITSIKSKQRTHLVHRERRRIIFGMNPISRIKVVTNRPRIELRHRLIAKGYLPGKDRFEMFYPSWVLRNERQERFGNSLGLRFSPLPTEQETKYSQVI